MSSNPVNPYVLRDILDAITTGSATGTVGASTGAQTSVTGVATDTTILAANSLRKDATIYNDSTAILYLLFASGTSSVTNMSVPLQPFDFLDSIPAKYTGVIKGIWSAAAGSARVTEFIA